MHTIFLRSLHVFLFYEQNEDFKRKVKENLYYSIPFPS